MYLNIKYMVSVMTEGILNQTSESITLEIGVTNISKFKTETAAMQRVNTNTPK